MVNKLSDGSTNDEYNGEFNSGYIDNTTKSLSASSVTRSSETNSTSTDETHLTANSYSASHSASYATSPAASYAASHAASHVASYSASYAASHAASYAASYQESVYSDNEWSVDLSSDDDVFIAEESVSFSTNEISTEHSIESMRNANHDHLVSYTWY